MRLLEELLRRRRLVIATTLLLAATGVASWFNMPREEDPQFPHRDGLIVTTFPGADALTVERLVVEPIEEHLAEVEAVREIDSTARAGVAIQHVELYESVYETDEAWDDVEKAIEAARQDFPAGVGEPTLDDDLISQDAVVYAVLGSADPLVLLDAAERLKRALLSISDVKRVDLMADPGEQITIEYDDSTARRLGIDARALGRQLAERSRIVPGGIVHLGEKTATLRPQTEFRTLDEIRSTPILLPSGSSVPLGELARVRRGPAEPAAERMRWNGEPAMAVAVVPQDGLDRVVLGAAIRARVAEIAPSLEPIRLEEVVFQPDLVEERIGELTGSLRLGIFIVALILFVAMGLRLGIVVASVVPLVTFASIALFALGGGILHQISIAALVIALGMLVDNAIVVAENIQYRLDGGDTVHEAAVASVKELALPLGTATGTTLAAFLPMLAATGNTADFTRSIPIMIMLTLTVSYLFAVLVTPVLSELLLRRRVRATESGDDGEDSIDVDAGERPLEDRSERLARRIGDLVVRRTGWVLLSILVLLAATIFAARWVDLKFFPVADRSTVVVELEMPEGTHLESTDVAALRLERALLEHPQVDSVGTFVGRNGPKFYYNLTSRPASPHRSMLMVEAGSMGAVEELIDWVRGWSKAQLPEASVVARRLEQGPAIDAPVELRVMGWELADLERVADALLAELQSIESTRDVRHDLSLGVPTVRFEIDDAEAGRHGLTRPDVAQSLLGRTLGLEIGQFRAGEDPVPILIRSEEGETLPVSELETIDVAAPGGDAVPLSQVADLGVEWLPAAIYHENRSRIVTVQAQVAGTTAYAVLAELQPFLDSMQLPEGVRVELGGELEESGKANAAIARQLPLGLLLLLFFLLLEFNSFRRVGIVLATVPLAAVGVVPGLILSGNPFGFMSLLGIISLVGIVVNNAIVLLDVIETRRAGGSSVDEALREAIQRRTRPILLTMATTVAGLSPLAFSEANLWPPLAWAMISGLIASTALTLLVIPSLYRILFARPSWRDMGFGPRSAAAAAVLVVLLVGGLFAADRAGAQTVPGTVPGPVPGTVPGPAAPVPGTSPGPVPGTAPGTVPGTVDQRTIQLTIEEAMERAATRPEAAAAEARAVAAGEFARAARRAATLPSIVSSGDVTWRDDVLELETPIGPFDLGEDTSWSGSLTLRQPLWDPSLRRAAPAAARRAEAAGARAHRTAEELRAEAAGRFLDVLAIDASRAATSAFVDSLAARLAETTARVEAGRALEANALKVRLDLEAAQLELRQLDARRRVSARDLGRVGGGEGPVEPRLPDESDREQTVDEALLESLVMRALADRHDVAALEARAAAAVLDARAVRGESLPSLDARATYLASDGDPFAPESQLRATVVLSWTPFAAGTRAPRAAAAEAEAEALRADLTALRRRVEVTVVDALAQVEIARETVIVRERGVELAEETLRVERERYTAGRSTTNDLLDAEATLRRQRTLRDVARLDVLGAWIEVDLATGGSPASDGTRGDVDPSL